MYLYNLSCCNFIIGSLDDVESVKWVKKIIDIYGILWYYFKWEEKDKLVVDFFIEEIVIIFFKNKWWYWLGVIFLFLFFVKKVFC